MQGRIGASIQNHITMENLQTHNVNGITLHYKKSGNGPPLVFIPGVISDYRTWLSISKQFKSDYTCYALSRRFQFPDNYPKGGDSSVAVNTKDISDFIRDKNLEPAIVVGHSYGGFIAISLALSYPQYVKELIVEEPIFAPALAKNPQNPLELIKLMFIDFKAGKSFARFGIKTMKPTSVALEKGDTATASEAFIEGMTLGNKTPETLDEITRQQLFDNIAALAGEDPFNNDIKFEEVRNIDCETLLISGTESPYFFQFVNKRLEKVIPNVKHISIPNTSHWTHIDKPSYFVDTVTEFLKK